MTTSIADMIIIIIFPFSGWVVTVTPKGRFWLRGPKESLCTPRDRVGGKGSLSRRDAVAKLPIWQGVLNTMGGSPGLLVGNS